MKPGDVSGVLRSSTGFHIVKLQEVRSRNQPTVVEQTHARHILIKVNEITSESEAKAKIDRIKDRIDSGAKFDEQARLNSEDASSSKGGDLGWISPGDTVPDFEQAMNEAQDRRDVAAGALAVRLAPDRGAGAAHAGHHRRAAARAGAGRDAPAQVRGERSRTGCARSATGRTSSSRSMSGSSRHPVARSRPPAFAGGSGVARAARVAAAAVLRSAATAQRSVPPADTGRPLAPQGRRRACVLRCRRRARAPHRAAAAHAAEAAAPKAMRGPPPQRAASAASAAGSPVGFARTLPAAERALSLAELPWRTTAEGHARRAARADVARRRRAPRWAWCCDERPAGPRGALPGSAGGAPVFGPVGAARSTWRREGVYWSPVLDGETARIEFALPPGVARPPAPSCCR